MAGEVGTSRWSHEQTWLSVRERDELRAIERRLRRDGLRLDVADRTADWPFQLLGLILAVAGASLVALVAAAVGSPLLHPLLWLGAVLVLVSALLAVTPIRAASRRAVVATRRVVCSGAWFRRRRRG